MEEGLTVFTLLFQLLAKQSSAALPPYCSVAKKIIRENYVELGRLPIDSMLGELFAKEVITLREKKIIQSLSLKNQKIEYLLDNIIIPSLDNNVARKFKGFLEVMEKSNDFILTEMSKKFGDSSGVVMMTNNDSKLITTFDELEYEFAITTKKIKKALVNFPDIDVTSLVEELQTFSAVKNKRIPLLDEDVFEKVTTVETLWQKLNKYWSVFNHDILLILLKLVKCEKANKIFEEFLSRIDSPAIEDLDLVLYCEVFESQRLKPCLRIKVKANKCSILLKRKVEEVISVKFALKDYCLCFKGIKEGCIELVYEISNAMRSYFLQCKFTGYDLAEFAACDIISLHLNDMELKVSSKIKMEKTCGWLKAAVKADEPGLSSTDEGIGSSKQKDFSEYKKGTKQITKENYDDQKAFDDHKKTRSLTAVGIGGGAGFGAAVGSVFPVVGTITGAAVGGILGGIVGGIVGGAVGGSIGSLVSARKRSEEREKQLTDKEMAETIKHFSLALEKVQKEKVLGIEEPGLKKRKEQKKQH